MNLFMFIQPRLVSSRPIHTFLFVLPTAIPNLLFPVHIQSVLFTLPFSKLLPSSLPSFLTYLLTHLLTWCEVWELKGSVVQ
jgi:hypothetical protein